ncbi:hypothetical protein M3Y94_01203000 [Aphelenchoides besseyi]|nr:hypothetical protein M3Y94_01203000 [Aphelenchoides besseyi]KAI6228453.1 hypothetical protein M3Y95_00623800 [Aphelenchoides besseyi]
MNDESATTEVTISSVMKALFKEYYILEEQKRAYKMSNEAAEIESQEMEDSIDAEKNHQKKLQAELNALRDKYALMSVEKEDLMEMDKTVDQTVNNSVLNLSATGTENDAAQFEQQILMLQEKKSALESDLKTLHNDKILMNSEAEELDSNCLELNNKIDETEDQLLSVEQKITETQQQKSMLTEQFDTIKVKLAEKEMNNQPKNTVERGNSGLAEYDEYVKKLKVNIMEARDQKRQLNLQHTEFSQRLSEKRHLLELADRNQVTKKTVVLASELSSQSVLLNYLKLCVDRFYRKHEAANNKLAADHQAQCQIIATEIKADLLNRTSVFAKYCGRTRDSACEIRTKATPAYQMELKRYNELKQQARQKALYDNNESEELHELEQFLLSEKAPFSSEFLQQL